MPDDPTFASDAEEAVWRRLRDQLPDHAVLMANLALTDRTGDREADLVVLWPDVGIAVVEVKGGHLTPRGDGRWKQVGNGTATIVDPVVQAKKCKYALRQFIRDHTSLGDCRMAHLVAFPYTRVPDDFVMADCPRWLVIDSTDVVAIAADRVESALRNGDGPAAPGTAHVGAVVDRLVGRPGTQRDLLAELEGAEHAVDLLTQQQASILHMLRGHQRIEVRGGAGTGKTFLAVEQARRLARSGRRVGFACYSRGLAGFLTRRFAQLPQAERPAYVGTFHQLGVAWGARPRAGAPQTYWDEDLPVEMLGLAAHLGDSDRFDAFVVDEAQDFADSWWPALTAGLRDPGTGGLHVFADEAQRVFNRHGRPPGAFTVVELDENLRNTKQIAQTFGSLAAEQMRYRGKDGPPVRFVPCGTDDAITAADDALTALMEEGWPNDALALLTTHHRHPVQVQRVEARGTAGYWDSFWDSDDAFFGHVLGFKGLERPAVVLAVDGFRDPVRAREMLYVGLSRARDLLVVCGDPELIRRHAGDGVLRRLTA